MSKFLTKIGHPQNVFDKTFFCGTIKMGGFMNFALETQSREVQVKFKKFLLSAKEENLLPTRYRLDIDNLAFYWELNFKPHWVDPYPLLVNLRRVCRKYGLPTSCLNPLIAILQECAKAQVCPATFLKNVIFVQANVNRNPKEWMSQVIPHSMQILAATKHWMNCFSDKEKFFIFPEGSVPMDLFVIQFLARPYASLTVREAKSPNRIQFFVLLTEKFALKNPVFNEFLWKKMSHTLIDLSAYLTYPIFCSLYENLIKIETGYLKGYLKSPLIDFLSFAATDLGIREQINQLRDFLEIFAFIVQDHDFSKFAEEIFRKYMYPESDDRKIFIELLKKNLSNRVAVYQILHDFVLNENNYFIEFLDSSANIFDPNLNQGNKFGNVFSHNLLSFLKNNYSNLDVVNAYEILKRALLTGSDNFYSEKEWNLIDRVLNNKEQQELFIKGLRFIPELSLINPISFSLLHEKLKSFPYGPNLFFKVVFGLERSINEANENEANKKDTLEETLKGLLQIINRFKACFTNEITSNNSIDEIIGFLDQKIDAIKKHIFNSKTPPTVEKRRHLSKQLHIYKKARDLVKGGDVYLKILLLFSLGSFHKEILTEALRCVTSAYPGFQVFIDCLNKNYEIIEKKMFPPELWEKYARSVLQYVQTMINLLLVNPEINDLLEDAFADSRGWYDVLCYFSPTKSSQKPLKIWDAILNRVFHVKDLEREIEKISKKQQNFGNFQPNNIMLTLYTVYSPLNYYHNLMGGICLSSGIELFADGKGFLLRLVDLTHQKVVGCVLAGFHKYQEQKVVIFYGINPLRSFLKNLCKNSKVKLYLNIRRLMEIISRKLQLPVYIPLDLGILTEDNEFRDVILNLESNENPIYSTHSGFNFIIVNSLYVAKDVALIIKPNDEQSFLANKKLWGYGDI